MECYLRNNAMCPFLSKFSDAYCCIVFFFFSSRRRHTRWNCDWSSDVCSSDLEWERALQGRHVEDRVDTRDVEPGETHRVALVDPELRVHVAPVAAHDGVDHRVHVPALAVQQEQADHVAAELELVEGTLLPESEPAEERTGRERARIGGGNRGAQGVAIDGVIALEGKPTDHPLRLLLRGEASRREYGDDEDRKRRTQLTRSGCLPMLARSRHTVNLFDT